MISEKIVWDAEEITCPHCGATSTDSWEMPEESDEEFCEECGGRYSYERHVEVTYCSTRLEEGE